MVAYEAQRIASAVRGQTTRFLRGRRQPFDHFEPVSHIKEGVELPERGEAVPYVKHIVKVRVGDGEYAMLAVYENASSGDLREVNVLVQVLGALLHAADPRPDLVAEVESPPQSLPFPRLRRPQRANRAVQPLAQGSRGADLVEPRGEIAARRADPPTAEETVPVSYTH